jgi:hypothetical protein
MTEPAGDPAPEFVVEGGRPLSKSMIWGLQRGFYSREGPAAWKPQGVPSYVTNNAFIARTYARMLVAMLRDLLRTGALDATQPVHVFELGGGPGRFTYLFLRALREARAPFADLAAVPVRFVLTDLVDANLQTARTHERLRPFVEEGLLDLAQYDLERDGSLRLLVSGDRVAEGSLRNPALVIANYAFDTIVHDVFRVRSNVLSEAHATVVSSQAEEDLADPAILERLKLRWDAVPLPEGAWYDDPLAERVLRDYARLGDTSVVMPSGALRCIRTLMGWTGGRLLLLVGDKCFTEERELARRGDPILGVHGGSFSFTVNFDAIGAYFEGAGGQAFRPQRWDFQFKVAAAMAGIENAVETQTAFANEIDRFGPGDYFHLSYTLRKELPTPSMEVMLAAFKLADWDPEMVVACRAAVTQKARGAPDWVKDELARGLDLAWERVFTLHRNFALELAWVAMAIDRPRQAIHLAQESGRVFGKDALSLTVLGLAHAMLKENATALKFAERALALQPDNAAAKQLKATLKVAAQAAPEPR